MNRVCKRVRCSATIMKTIRKSETMERLVVIARNWVNSFVDPSSWEFIGKKTPLIVTPDNLIFRELTSLFRSASVSSRGFSLKFAFKIEENQRKSIRLKMAFSNSNRSRSLRWWVRISINTTSLRIVERAQIWLYKNQLLLDAKLTKLGYSIDGNRDPIVLQRAARPLSCSFHYRSAVRCQNVRKCLVFNEVEDVVRLSIPECRVSLHYSPGFRS